jgi:hypothetical protein
MAIEIGTVPAVGCERVCQSLFLRRDIVKLADMLAPVTNGYIIGSCAVMASAAGKTVDRMFCMAVGLGNAVSIVGRVTVTRTAV